MRGDQACGVWVNLAKELNKELTQKAPLKLN